MNNFYDMYGLLHDKPVTPLNPFPCNDSMILTAILQKISDESYKTRTDWYVNHLAHVNTGDSSNTVYPVERVPYKPTPYCSRDFFLGMASLKLIDVDTMIRMNWNFSPVTLPKFNFFKTVSSFILAIGEHRNYLWKKELTHAYRFMFSVPLTDRAYYFEQSGKKAPMIYRLIAAIDKMIKPKKNSAKFIRFLKYDYQPSLSDWLEKCNRYEDHPLYVKALSLK